MAQVHAQFLGAHLQKGRDASCSPVWRAVSPPRGRQLGGGGVDATGGEIALRPQFDLLRSEEKERLRLTSELLPAPAAAIIASRTRGRGLYAIVYDFSRRTEREDTQNTEVSGTTRRCDRWARLPARRVLPGNRLTVAVLGSRQRLCRVRQALSLPACRPQCAPAGLMHVVGGLSVGLLVRPCVAAPAAGARRAAIQARRAVGAGAHRRRKSAWFAGWTVYGWEWAPASRRNLRPGGIYGHAGAPVRA